MNIKKIVGLLFITILASSSFVTASLTPPPVVAGIISTQNGPIEGISIRVDNLDNGEFQEQTTAYHNPPHSTAGGYAVCMPANVGDMIRVTVFYNDLEYSDIFAMYSEDDINWFNFTFNTDTPPIPPDDPPYPPPNPPDEPPDEESPDDPLDEEPEPDEQNETEIIYYNLTVSVFDNITKSPINNASVTIYDIETNIIAENNTDKSGNVTFQLEEGEYIVEAVKDDYPVKRTRVSVSASSFCIFSLKETQDQNNDNSYIPSNTQEQGFPYFYVGTTGIIIVLIAVFLYFWKS